jgi:glycosyltransferase involved in cell wall biosynthesis
MIKVSIVIPVYNTEKYIERCIDSVLNQTYRNIEVIVVDDCSPDNSDNVLKDIINRSNKAGDLEFKFLKHEHNSGLSAARNTGIRASSGDYIFLLDSDDELPSSSIEHLVSLAEKYPGVDMVQGNIWCNDSHLAEWVTTCNKGFPEFTRDKEWITKQFININYNSSTIPVTAYSRLYHRSLFFEKNMFFKKGIIHEDEHWRLIYGPHIESIAFCFETTYNYHIRPGSITTKKKTDNKRTVSLMMIYEDYLPHVGNYPQKDLEKIVLRIQNLIRDKYNTGDYDEHLKICRSYMNKFYRIKTLPLNMRLIFKYFCLPPFFQRGKITKALLRALSHLNR